MDKVCRDCGECKPLEDFPPSKKNKDGRVSYCRPCSRVRNRAYRDARTGGGPTRKHSARLSSPENKWCAQCQSEQPRSAFGSNRSSRGRPDLLLPALPQRRVRELREQRHGTTRDFHLKRRYGLTSADVDAMVVEQGGVCAVCRTRPPQHVDHDHLTGLVRGILCSTCNQGLGNFARRRGAPPPRCRRTSSATAGRRSGSSPVSCACVLPHVLPEPRSEPDLALLLPAGPPAGPAARPTAAAGRRRPRRRRP